MEDIKYNETGELKKTVKPSIWVGVPNYLDVTALTIDMGSLQGTSTEYVERIDKIPMSAFLKVTRYDGKELWINPKYIIKAQNFRLARATLKTNRLDVYPTGSKTYYVLLDEDKELRLGE